MEYRFTSAALMMALLIFPGTCKKKKPDVPPPQATAPTQTQPQPQQQAPTATTEPTQKTEQKPAQQAPATTTTPAKPKPKPHPSTTTTKKPQPEMKRPAPPVSATAPKPATPPASTEPGQLTASVSNMEAARKRQETAQLLALTDGELKGITRTLDRDEQNIVLQIRGYMQQAHIADKDGDLDRARNLAVKAKLLADDLVKPK